MQDEKIVVGLDIGSTKVCAVVGRMNEHDKLEILGVGNAISEGVKEGTVNNIAKTVTAIQEAIQEAEKTNNVEIKVVNVGIGSKYIQVLSHYGSITRKSYESEITLDDVNQLTQDMHRLVISPGNEIIHVIPQHYAVDNEVNIKDPIGMSGVRLEANFNLITVQVEAMKRTIRCVERFGLDIENMILSPLASSLSVLTTEEKEAGVCMIDIGGGTTDIAIFQDSILRYTAIIPFGGNNVTQDIRQGVGIMQEQAEQLKIKFGRAISSDVSENEFVSIRGIKDRPPKEVALKDVALIIEARMEEIIELVKAEIKRSGLDGKLGAGIVLTGGGSQLRLITELFKKKINMDVRIGYPNEYLERTKFDVVKHPSYATAIGLLLAGFKPLDDRYDRKSVAYAQKYQQKSAKKSAVRGRDLFSEFIKNPMNFLLDDIDDKNYL